MPEIHSDTEVQAPIQLQVTHHGNRLLAENIACAVHSQVDGMQFGHKWTRMAVARQNVEAVRDLLKKLGVLESDIQVLPAIGISSASE